ncbi:phosphoethanolamine transferase [Cellvibrio fontiphilus]|uniref:Phosphoethanolamine transferase n=1 Tax=Cellvibrio fontiphilus TaxID=1815559 RepID=A0ABV7FFD1_9GAMM
MYSSVTARLPVLGTRSASATLLAGYSALLMVLLHNARFFSAAWQVQESSAWPFMIALAVLLWLCTFWVLQLILLPLVLWPRAVKPVLMALMLTAAGTAYFMDSYGIVIHGLMIQNLMETDVAEARGLFSGRLLVYLLLLGAAPALLLAPIPLVQQTRWREVWQRTKAIALTLLAILLLVLSASAQFSSFFRNHKEIRQMANPLNVIYASAVYAAVADVPLKVASLGTDAKLSPWAQALVKPNLLIVVVGETARADHFALNGYPRDTTPQLAAEDLVNFSQVTSCGTETAVSVPCMFSHYPRAEYTNRRGKSQESVLDVLAHAGIPVLWRDNNSSCKGACDRVGFEDMQHLNLPELCNDQECFDNVLLYQLDQKIAQMPNTANGNKVIVLHQKGSHGPDYYHRYPQDQEVFSPSCHTNQLSDCTQEQVINAFDNTIHYTDQFLARTIHWLQQQESQYNTAMIYLSDHGESLGEQGIYLHGMPYVIAPKAQTHVPMLWWLSSGFERSNQLDKTCLLNRRDQAYSQDNLFHTLLGLMNVSTSVYDPALDMTAPCRRAL